MIKGIIKINDDLFLIKRIMSDSYESLGPDWNQISPNHKTFKKDGKLFFCELIEIIEEIEETDSVELIVENPTI